MESSKNIDATDGKDELKLISPTTGKTNELKVSSKQLICKICSESFLKKEDRWEHLKIHFEEGKLLTCQFCPFVTEMKQYQLYHIRTHTGEKPYKCEQCPYKCASRTMLNMHVRKHDNFYQYLCQNCPYVSKYSHIIKRHFRISGHKGVELHKHSGKMTEINAYHKSKLGRKCKSPIQTDHLMSLPASPFSMKDEMSEMCAEKESYQMWIPEIVIGDLKQDDADEN